MSTVSDYSLANQGFSAFRTELNNILGAINTHNLGTSAPSSLAAGSIWVDSSSSGTHTLKYYDGSDSITLCDINTSANTVNFIDSTVASDLLNDSSPQLGANLDTNSFNILIDDAHFIADENGNVISWSSAGSKGFNGSRKSTPYAAQVAADDAGSKAYEIGLRTLSVQVKGPGSGRETALRALQSRGFKITSIKDTTPLPHNGTRPPKKRRV